MTDAGGARAIAGLPMLRWAAFLAVPLVAALVVQQGVYSQVPASFMQLLGVVAALLLAAAVVDAKWPGSATVAAGVVALLLVYYCGAASLLAFVLLALAGSALGSMLDPRMAWPAAVRLLAGMSVMVAVVGWLLPFPVHGSRAYLLVAAVLCWWRRDALLREWRMLADGWHGLARAVPRWLLLAVGAAFVASLGLWLPSLNYDDNSAHLILPHQLLADGYYHLDVSTQVWAVAPWANNVLHGIAALFAGTEARPAANLLWLLLGMNGAWRLARSVGATDATALAAASVYACLPLTGYFTTAMQVDGASGAVLMHLAAMLVAAGRALPPAVAMGALLALMAGLKATNAIFALPAIAWVAWLAIRQRNWAWLAVAGGLAILLSGASYFYASWITGNPLFPLFNGVFKSPYYPPLDFIDPRWQTGMGWRLPWDLTVHTDRFGEVYPGAWGFALLALLPALLLDAVRDTRSRWLLLWFAASGIVLFAQVQYLRYVFPSMACLVVLGVVALGRVLDRRLLALASVVLVVGNALLLPTSSWMARENPWQSLLRSGNAASARIEAQMAPSRVLLERVLVEDARACVLLADAESPYIGVAGGRAQSIKSGYDPRMSKSFEWAKSDPSGARWDEFLASVGPSHVVTGPGAVAAFTEALVAAGFATQDREGPYATWAASDPARRQCTGNLERVRDEAHRRVHPGDTH
jgi:hypothetical protein